MCVDNDTCHLSPVTCHLSPVTYHLSPVTRHLSPVTYHLSPVTCHLSPVTSHMSNVTYVTRHMSSVTCHMSLQEQPQQQTISFVAPPQCIVVGPRIPKTKKIRNRKNHPKCKNLETSRDMSKLAIGPSTIGL